MEVVISQFVKSLCASGLLTADEIEAFVERLPPEKKPDDGAALAKELVRQKKLTKFQAQAVYQGKTKLVLGDYVVLDRIGQGGMGQVYKAKHTTMDRVVALKTLPSSATKSQRAIQRFHREAKVAARLSHPNIVTAHDARESQGVHFLVMEHVEGSDLASLVKKHGRLPVSTALDYVTQAAKGLEYAHGKDVIHRDIKPSNLVLDSEGTVKVLDMGLARLNETIGSSDATAEETLTGTGQAMGTIDYMPPEQAENTKTVDQRADIYSLGCTLYFLLKGRSVYSGDTTVQKVLAHRESPIPSLQSERPDVPERLDLVYQQMVAKKPDDRYATMTEVIAELEKCAAVRQDEISPTESFDAVRLVQTASPDQETISKHEPPEESLPLDFPVVAPSDDLIRKHIAKPLNRRVVSSAIAGVASFLVVVLLFGVVLKLRTPDGKLVLEINEPDAVVQVLDEEGKVEIERKGEKGKLSISVDPGKHRLRVEKSGFSFFTKDFEIESGGTTRIRARLERLGERAAVSSLATQQTPSPPLVTSEAETGTAESPLLRTLTGHIYGIRSLAFSPDGSMLASFGSDKGPWLWDVSSGKLLWTSVSLGSGGYALAFSPDGLTLATTGGSAKSVKLWDVSEDELRFRQDLEGHSEYISSLAYSPDGSLLASGSGDNMVIVWDATTGKKLLTLTGFCVAISPDSSTLATGDGDGNTILWDVASGEIRRTLEKQNWRIPCVAFNPEGLLLASVGGSGQKKVIIWDTTTGEQRQVLDGHTQDVRCVAFSPDGAMLASCGTDLTVIVWDVESGGILRRLTGHSDLVTSVAFRPDGTLLASASHDKTIKLWDVSALTKPQTDDPRHRAAEWVLGIGGHLQVLTNGEVVEIEDVRQLPSDEWIATSAKFYRHELGDDAADKGVSDGFGSLKAFPGLRGVSCWDIHLKESDLQALEGCDQFKTIALVGCSLPGNALFYLRNLTTLEIVDLTDSEIDGSGLKNLAGLINLQRLNLQNTDVSDEALSQLGSLNQLGILDLRGTQVTDTGLQSLSVLEHLRKLKLSSTGITDAGLQNLKGLKNLTRLEIADTKVTEAGISELQTALPNCEIILDSESEESMDDRGSASDDPDRGAAEWVLQSGGHVTVSLDGQQKEIRRIADVPTGTFRIVVIEFSANQTIADGSLVHLKGLVGLRHLQLSHTRVTDGGLQYLQALDGLRSLGLSGTRVTGTGLKYLARLRDLQELNLDARTIQKNDLEGVAQLANLQRLNLSQTRTNDIDLEYVKSLKNLVHLELRDTKVTPAGVADLQAALPNCKIILDADADSPEPDGATKFTPPDE